ncbi:MAG: response regulator [Pseudomonadota bacterium]
MQPASGDIGAVAPPILIVDDDATNLFVLEEFLRSAGFNTVTAANGVEAVDAHRRHNPPLILMDLSMPVMDGFEASRRIFAAVPEHQRRPVILAVSANVTPEWKTSCLEIGMEDFVEKPIDFDSLVERMKTLYARMGY